jgi:hypothetical protein
VLGNVTVLNVTADWQQLVALLCVAVALFVLGRRSWRLWKGTSRAGSACASCPVHEGSKAPQAKPLVTLELRAPAGHSSAGGPDNLLSGSRSDKRRPS